MAPPLSFLRFPEGAGRGRRFPELDHAYRTPFQRDRDRIIHARAFRRLEDKTQVFAAGLSDHFRNRLTHTIEVAQISRTVAAALGLNEDLTEALALAHDIGHPPFAHAGEAALNELMSEFGGRFDHNLHALRIVEQFESRYARFPGLNLTFEVREGMAKHSRDFAPGEFPELDEYLPGLRPTLEAQLIDLCDEIAYNTADLDDGFDAGLISMRELTQQVPAVGELNELAEGHFPAASERLRLNEIVRELINLLVSGLVQGTTDAVAAAGVTSVDQVRQHPVRLAVFAPAVVATNQQLKRFLRSFVYDSTTVQGERRQSAQRIHDLFHFLLAHPEHLPPAPYEEDAPLHVRICDYLAGMTDGFLHRTHARLTGS
jgi:dGTPase